MSACDNVWSRHVASVSTRAKARADCETRTANQRAGRRAAFVVAIHVRHPCGSFVCLLLRLCVGCVFVALFRFRCACSDDEIKELCESLEYRRVLIRGRFLNDTELYVEPRSHNGEAGVQIVVPFMREVNKRTRSPNEYRTDNLWVLKRSSQDGTVLLVNRGWCPREKKLPSTRPESIVSVESINVIVRFTTANVLRKCAV
jgi:hypothetical protein